VYGLTTAGSGVVGKSTSGPGVSGISDSHNGVQGSSKAATGVAATSDSGAGRRGKSTSGPGVHGESSSNNGVEGIASTATGVYGQSTAGAGVWAYTDAANVPALIGQGGTDGTGVLGLSGPGTPTAGPRLTGVYGYAAQSTASRGVYGQSTVGAGVIGEATSGIGVQASASSGVALRVSGRAAFSRSGRASVPAKANHVDVVVPGGLSSSASVLATLQLPRGTVHVTSARINYPKAGTVRISLNAVASTTASTPVAWFVLG
jgi:hypothetical protein